MPRKLFCEISPLCYQISVHKCCAVRRLHDFFSTVHFAKTFCQTPLTHTICTHQSLICRKLGNTDLVLQAHKAQNLAIAAPLVNGILIRPGETFSFWHLVGACTARKGYLDGLTIAHGMPSHDIGGGMCQFTNLIHWLVLHTSLTITEHHHHDGVDLFPDYGRVIPFGLGTSILYNYLDYRVRNDTDNTYQLMVFTDGTYLHGTLYAKALQPYKYHIAAENEHFVREGGIVYRCGNITRRCVDKRTGNTLETVRIKQNHARVAYDTQNLTIA
ncbi:MAG: VanW family protein [Ruthenibacterium sp.]